MESIGIVRFLRFVSGSTRTFVTSCARPAQDSGSRAEKLSKTNHTCERFWWDATASTATENWVDSVGRRLWNNGDTSAVPGRTLLRPLSLAYHRLYQFRIFNLDPRRYWEIDEVCTLEGYGAKWQTAYTWQTARIWCNLIIQSSLDLLKHNLVP